MDSLVNSLIMQLLRALTFSPLIVNISGFLIGVTLLAIADLEITITCDMNTDETVMAAILNNCSPLIQFNRHTPT